MLPIYPEQRLCKRPTAEQILRLFSVAQRHILMRDAREVCRSARTAHVGPGIASMRRAVTVSVSFAAISPTDMLAQRERCDEHSQTRILIPQCRSSRIRVSPRFVNFLNERCYPHQPTR